MSFGAVKPAETVSRRMVLRGKEPFRITMIAAEGEGLTFEFDEQAMKDVHVVPVTYSAPRAAGSALQHVTITTDHAGECAEITAHAWIVEEKD